MLNNWYTTEPTYLNTLKRLFSDLKTSINVKQV